MAFEPELKAALDAAELAGRLIVREYADFEAIPDAPSTITTQVDRDSQEVILRHLKAAFPADALCAEESTPTLQGIASTGERVWIVDPIDGTRGFAQKNGEFSVMIALVSGGEIVVGVVLEPVQWRTTYAVRGGGCFVRTDAGPTPCRVTPTATLAESTLVQSRSRHDRGPTGPVRKLKPGSVTETYSAGVKLARVARGEADLYVIATGTFRDWDLCAGHILVEEAGGGRVTNVTGGPLRYGLAAHVQDRGMVASNGALHDAAVAGMRPG